MVAEALSPELLFPQLIKILMIGMNKVAVFFVVFMGPLEDRIFRTNCAAHTRRKALSISKRSIAEQHIWL